MTIEEQKRAAHIISDALVANENIDFNWVSDLYDEQNMYDSHNIMRLMLLYYRIKTGQIEKQDAVLRQVEILNGL